MAFLVVVFIIFATSSSTPKAAPVAPLPQITVPVAAPVAPKHVVKKHKQKHVAHRAPATAAEAPAEEPSKPNVDAEANAQSH